MNVHKVKVKTTDYAHDTFCVKNDNYLSCIDSTIYVICKDAAQIYKRFGNEVIISVTKIGIGYIFKGDTK